MCCWVLRDMSVCLLLYLVSLSALLWELVPVPLKLESARQCYGGKVMQCDPIPLGMP